MFRTVKRFHFKQKLEAVERILGGEDPAHVAASLGAQPDLVRKWHHLFGSAGRRALSYTSDEGERPRLEDLRTSAQKAFPIRRLHGCRSAISFFCAQFYGKNDIIHIYRMGVPNVTIVDLDGAKLATMKTLYPCGWDFVEGNAFEICKSLSAESRKFDLVTCDPYSSLAREVSWDNFDLFISISNRFLLLLYTQAMFDELGIDPEPKALSKRLTERMGRQISTVDITQRSTHAGGVYWCLFSSGG